jgi:hypothetical protein
MKATSPADAVGITMKVFPADVVGIQVISCSVLRLHILLLLRWESCSELLHNTNPLRQLCVQKLFRSATDTSGFVCSSGTRDVLDGKRSISDQASPREAGRTGHCAQPSVYQLATAVDPASAASSCWEFFTITASASSRRSPPEYHNGEPTDH